MGQAMISLDSDQLRFDLPLDVEDIRELHAARLLVFLSLCGEGNTRLFRGRLRLSKLDFFVRFPQFLEIAVDQIRERDPGLPPYSAGVEGLDVSQVPLLLAPWDQRCDDAVGFLASRSLIRRGGSSTETYSLTAPGLRLAASLAEQAAFRPIIARCELLRETLNTASAESLLDIVHRALAVYGSRTES
jgi:hypothetical protein